MKFICLFFVILFVLKGTSAFSKQGVWYNVQFPQDKGYMLFTKSMYKDTIISLKVDCSSKTSANVKIDWLLRYTPCAQEFQSVDGARGESVAVEMMMSKGPHKLLFLDFNYDTIEYITDQDNIQTCDGSTIFLEPKTKVKPTIEKLVKVPEKTGKTKAPTTEKTKEDKDTDTPKPARRKRNDTTDPPKGSETGETHEKETGKTTASQTADNLKVTTLEAVTTNGSVTRNEDQVYHPSVAKVWKSGYYVFIIRISAINQDETFDAKLSVAMKGNVGYISAVDWPLLIFYGVMSLVYLVYGLVWLLLLACNWRDLIRLHYWIGGVIVLGMLENVLLYADYQNIANGKSVTEGTVIFAKVVSSLKRALFRMLVIIVNKGVGIAKPRLGRTFYRVALLVGVFFILATVEGSIRTLEPKGETSTGLVLVAVPLAVVDMFICWWIFSSLAKTTRKLRLGKNVVKITLYRHFTYTLIFAVLASIVFMIWSVIQIKMKICLRAWREIWLDEAFWHLLFSVIMAIIMILWRPSSNNQRYTFSPLIDAADGESVLDDAFDEEGKQMTKHLIEKMEQLDKRLEGMKKENEHIKKNTYTPQRDKE